MNNRKETKLITELRNRRHDRYIRISSLLLNIDSVAQKLPRQLDGLFGAGQRGHDVVQLLTDRRDRAEKAAN
jgi:hypothetical protein